MAVASFLLLVNGVDHLLLTDGKSKLLLALIDTGGDAAGRDWLYWNKLQRMQEISDAARRLGKVGGIASGINRRRK